MSEKSQWGLLVGTVVLFLVLVGSLVFTISYVGASPSRESEVAALDYVDRDERHTARDQIGRTVYSPKAKGGDVFPSDGEKTDRGWDARPTVEWQRIKGSTDKAATRDVPFSPDSGPFASRDGVASGFAHSPQGAALAGIHILQGLGRGGIDAARTAKRFVDDPKTEQIMDQIIAEDRGDAMPELPWSTVFWGYEVIHYTDDAATIKYALENGDGYTSWSINLFWVDGDWKIKEKSVSDTREPLDETALSQWVKL